MLKRTAKESIFQEVIFGMRLVPRKITNYAKMIGKEQTF